MTRPLYGYVNHGWAGAGYTTPDGELADTTGRLGEVMPYSSGAISHSYMVDQGSYSAHFTVTDPGPAYLTVESVQEGSSDGWFGTSAETKGRAVFIVAAPVGATVRLSGDSGQNVGDLRLEIDREGDGTFDDERKPDFVKTGDDLSDVRDVQTTATVEAVGANEVLVSLAADGTERVERTYFWLFPNDPLPRRYDERFVVKQPSYLMFASLDSDGNLDVVQERRLLGGASDISAPLELDEALVVHFDEPGRVAKLTFDGREGQRIVPQITAPNLGPFPCCSGRMQAFGPDGEALTAPYGVGHQPYTMRTLLLPSDGVYTFVVDPYLAYTGDVTVEFQALRDVTATIQPDGEPLTVSFEHAEQRGFVSFDGRDGQQVSIVVERPESSRCCSPEVAVVSPPGETLASGEAQASDEDFVMLEITLPEDGTYTITLASKENLPGDLTVALNAVRDVEEHIAFDAPPQTVRFTTPGQRAMLTFSGAAGQEVFLSAIDGIANDDGDLRTRLTLLRDGESRELVRAWLSPEGTSVAAATLPEDGDYTVVLDPPLDMTGSVDVGLLSTAPEAPLLIARPMAADGTAIPITLQDPRQHMQRSFTGTEGQLFTLQIDDVTGSGASNQLTYWVHVYGPDGGEVELGSDPNAGLFGTDGLSTPIRLPATGVYVIDVQPYGRVATGNFKMSLTPIDDIAVTATVSGPPLTIETTVPGQAVRVDFAAEAGQVVVSATLLEVSQAPDSHVNYSIPGAVHPEGESLVHLEQGKYNQGTWRLPAGGEYTIEIVPSGATTFTVTLEVGLPPEPEPPPEPAALEVNGPPADADLTHEDGPAKSTFTFNGESGQQVTVEARMTIAVVGREVCCGFELALYQPDGTEIASTREDNGSLRLDATLPVTGPYEIRLRAIGNVIGHYEVTVVDTPGS